MDLFIGSLVEQTGVAPRTIREYIARGLVPRPRGYGSGALYGREHLLRLWAIAKLRRDGWPLADIAEKLAQMSPREMARCKPPAPAAADATSTSTPPASTATPDPSQAPYALPEVDAEPVTPGRLRHRPRASALPDGPHWLLVPLLPGLALMVRDDAAPVVRDFASDIVSRCGTSPRAQDG